MTSDDVKLKESFFFLFSPVYLNSKKMLQALIFKFSDVNKRNDFLYDYFL